MKMNILAASSAVFAVATCGASESWLGEISMPDAPVLFQLTHDPRDQPAAQLKIFAVNTKVVPVSRFTEGKGHVQAEFKLGDGSVVLDAEVDDDKARGVAQIGEKKFPLVLQRVVSAPSADVKGRIFRTADDGLSGSDILANLAANVTSSISHPGASDWCSLRLRGS